LARLHARIANIRADFTHKLTTRLCRENQALVIEDLHVKGMLANDRLARAISDVGFGMFRSQMEYKAKRHGTRLVIADRWYPSSRLCSACGWKHESLTLNDRQWTCPKCGTRHERDLYDASGTLKEAKELSVGYVAKTGRFAYAEYKFESFMDTDQVRRVIEMVGTKYGKPSSFRGSYGLGNVSAQWNLPGGINLEVRRGWPSTTTYLTYSHSANYAAMRQEIQAQEKRQQQQEAQRQSKAF
jgi:IS605 OrfB family transposase